MVRLFSSAIEEVDKALAKLIGQRLPLHLYKYYEPQTDLSPREQYSLAKVYPKWRPPGEKNKKEKATDDAGKGKEDRVIKER